MKLLRIKTIVLIVLWLSCNLSAAGNNDYGLDIDFSGESNGYHQGNNGIMSITVTNEGPSIGSEILVSGFYIESLSGEDASPFFLLFMEQVASDCNYSINFHVDPVPDFYYFLRVEFPDIPANSSYTCQFRYRFTHFSPVTTFYRVDQIQNTDPVPDNDSVQITLGGFILAVPGSSLFFLCFLIGFVLFVARTQFLKHNNHPNSQN